MRARGLTLSLMAVTGLLLGMMPGGEAVAQSTPPIYECRDELAVFQQGRKLGVLGQPWTNTAGLNRVRQKCSLFGWYEGVRDFCTERNQLASGEARRHGVELCLYKDTRGSVGGSAEGMDALAEMLAGLNLSTPLKKSVGIPRYQAQTNTLLNEYKTLKQSSALDGTPDLDCGTAQNEETFLALGRAAALRDFRVVCVKMAVNDAALVALESDPYTSWYQAQVIGLDYANATAALTLAKADVALAQELLATNDTSISAAYRQLYDTTNPSRQQDIKRQIALLEGEKDSLQISLDNAIDRRSKAEEVYREKQRIFEAKRAELNRS